MARWSSALLLLRSILVPHFGPAQTVTCSLQYDLPADIPVADELGEQCHVPAIRLAELPGAQRSQRRRADQHHG